jgi:hypothetical protein
VFLRLTENIFEGVENGLNEVDLRYLYLNNSGYFGVLGQPENTGNGVKTYNFKVFI